MERHFLSVRFIRIKLLTAILAFGVAGSLLLPAGLVQAQSRILFVGNSFTNGNDVPVLNYNVAAITDENFGLAASNPRYETDLPGPWGGVPGIFKKFTDQAGLAYEVHIEAINGVTLEYHFNNALSVLQQVPWDRVVLQEYSTRPLPVARGGSPSAFFDYSTRLEQAVHAVNPAAKIYLYETWARADLTYPANQPYSGLSIEAMGTDLHDGYYQAVAQNKNIAAVAPAGDAWLRAIQAGVAMRNPYTPTAGLLNLWDNYFHASKWGSYLNTCVLFFQITGVDPRTLGAQEQAAADLGITPTDAGNLQQIAYEQVVAAMPPASYTLTVSTTGSGTVAKSPNQATYVSGTPVTLTASAAPGYQFTGWTGDTTATTNPLTVAVTRNRNITATFTPVPGQYTLVVTSSGNGTVAKSPDQLTYASGTSVTLTASPAVGYQFTGWSGDTTSTANPLTVMMKGNKSIAAAFSPVPPPQLVTGFSLINADNGLVIQVLANGNRLNLAALPTRNLNVRADASPATVGSVVFALRGAQVQDQSDSVFPYALFGDVNGMYNAWTPLVGNYSLLATPYTASGGGGSAGTALSISFDVIDQPLIGPFTMTTAVVGSGTVKKNPSQLTYHNGTRVVLTAVPNAGYQFTGWSGDTTATTNPLSVTMHANKSITATFAVVPPQYTLTVSKVGSGTVAKDPDQTSYASGTSVVLTATAATGYQFSRWSGAATGSANPLTVAMTASKSITATFTAVSTQQVTSFTLVKANVSTNTDIQPLADGAILNLATLPTRNLNIRANTSPATVGSVVLVLSGAQTRNQTESVVPYALFSDNNGVYNAWTPPVGNYTLTATTYTGSGGSGTPGVSRRIAFSVINQTSAGPYTLALTTSGSGTVTKTPNQTSYASGTSVTLTASPATGYQLTGWSGDATGTTSTIAVVMNANKNVTATFALIPPQYTLTTAVVGSGTVAKSPNQATYTSGATVSVSAVPAAGYQFSGWSDAATGTANPVTVTMSSNKTITATFTATTASYSLAVTTVGSGTVAKSPNLPSYASGTSVTLAATPAAGYQFTGWSVDATGTASTIAVVMNANKNITATFALISSSQTFYRGLNLNGGAIVLDGQSWEASTGALNFSVTGIAFANQSIVLNPTTDATRAGMIRSSVYSRTLTATLSNVPAATYAVYLYFWEDNFAETFSISIQGAVVKANYNSGAPGHWDRLGPFLVTLTTGTITITTSGGAANLSGIEVWRQNPAARMAPPAASAVLATASPAAQQGVTKAEAYPNPSHDGRFWVVLPADSQGEVSYTLVSALGSQLASGKLALAPTSTTAELDFEHEMLSAGLYYLLLQNHRYKTQFKLIRL